MRTYRSPMLPALLSCLFAALISVGAYIAVPIPASPVPIVLQNMFIILAAMILGPWWGLLSVALYLGLGAAGLPVFSGGSGGIAKFAGPTGGYLLGYLPASIACGFIAQSGSVRSFLKNIAAGFAGMIIVYIAGVLRLKSVLNIDWNRALASGLYPFIPGDLLKIILAAVLALRVSKGLDALIAKDSNA